MDFGLIESHPWATTGIVLGGGIVLYLVFRHSGGGSAAAAPAISGGYAAVDPNARAADSAAAAQTAQLQAQLAALGIQGSTQIQLAQIAAGSSGQQVAASQEVTDTQTLAALRSGMQQTSAELQLGLASQQATVDLARISAGVQLASINAIVAAYGGHTVDPVNAPPVLTNPINQVITTNTPVSAGGYDAPVGYVAPAAGGAGDYLVPRPNFATCDPRDSNCVNRNQGLDVLWTNQTLAAQATNNRAQCLANAEQSKGMTNYAALVAACG